MISYLCNLVHHLSGCLEVELVTLLVKQFVQRLASQLAAGGREEGRETGREGVREGVGGHDNLELLQ